METRDGERGIMPKVLFISLYDVAACPIRTLHAFLKEKGYSVSIIFFKELLFNQIDKPTQTELNLLVTQVKEINPDFICLSVKSPLVSIAIEISELLRTEIGKPIIWGGSHPTIVPEECIKYADIVCVGEGEYAMLELLEKSENGQDITKIKNLWVRIGGTIIENPVRDLIANLDSLPFFDYSTESKYSINYNKLTMTDPILNIGKLNTIIGRGCPFRCHYCCNAYFLDLYKGKGCFVRKKSVNRAIQELLHIKTHLKNLKEIYFSDEVLAIDKEWIAEFSREYKEKVKIPFCCSFNPININDDIVRMLKEAGLVYIQMGIQSGSQRVRERVYNRFTSDEMILDAARIMKKYKITPKYDIILDNVYETEHDKEDSFNFLLKLPRPYDLSLYSLINFPKTGLTQRLITDGKVSGDNSEKALKQWRMTFGVIKRDKNNLHYNSMVSLLSKSFIPLWMIRRISKSKYLREHPQILVSVVKVSNHIKLANTAIVMILTGRMSIQRMVYHLKNYRGITI